MVSMSITLTRNGKVIDGVDAATFPAASNLLSSRLQPLNGVGSSRGTSASNVSVVLVTVNNDRISNSSLSASIQRSSVENVNSLSETEKFESGKTSLLFNISGDSAFSSTRTNQSLWALDFSKSLGSLSNNLLVSWGLLEQICRQSCKNTYSGKQQQ